MSKLIDGVLVANSVKAEVKAEVEALKQKGISVGLAVILVGNNAASEIYVRNKQRACEAVGINSYKYLLSESTTKKELLALIEKLNGDSKVNGILCQLPLPSHINKSAVVSCIDPIKDVDGFNPQNAGKMLSSSRCLLPCTPQGVIKLLDYYGIEIEGKNCAVIGRSDIVGKPMAVLLNERNATVTLCHSKTKDMKNILKNADIIVSATGKPKLVTADMVKAGAVVIDVGITRENGKLCGDVDFENVSKKASFISPVPGGVGPMTIAMLLKNTLKAAKLQNGEA